MPRANRALSSLPAALHGYRPDPTQEIHALRMLRSMLHGFSTLELAGGFQVDTDIDEIFTWMITFVDQGLQMACRWPELDREGLQLLEGSDREAEGGGRTDATQIIGRRRRSQRLDLRRGHIKRSYAAQRV